MVNSHNYNMAKQIITAEQLQSFYKSSPNFTETKTETTVTPTVTPETKQDTGFLSNLKSSFMSGLGKIKSGFQTTQEGAKNTQNITQGATQQARGALGMASGAIETAFSPLTAGLQTATQLPGVKQVVGGVENKIINPIVDKIANIPSVQKFAMENPNAEQVISDLINVIGTAYSPEIGKGATKTVGAITDVASPVVGEALQKSGKLLQTGTESAIKQNALASIRKLLEPIETKTTRQNAVSRTTEKGILGTKVVEPTTREAQMFSVVSEVPTVNPKNTFQSNYNALRKFNVGQAQQLERQIADNNFLIPRKETISRLKNASAMLDKSPVIVGDAQNTAKRLIAGAQKFINESDGTASGVLEARKKYDQWILSQKPKAFDANTENAFTLANREVRKTLNDLLAEKAPNVDVKGSLQKQSLIYDALNILEEKAAVEGKNRITRALNSVGEIVGAKSKGMQTIASLGLLGGGAALASTALPATLAGGAGYLLYRGGKWIVSPQVRKAIGQILETAGNKLNPSDKKILEQLSGKGLPKQGGFIKNPLSQSDNLIQEAKKYKSAEEFVRAKANMLHGSKYGEIKEFISDFTRENGTKNIKGIHLTPDRRYATTFAKDGGITNAFANVKNTYKIKKGTNSFTGLDNNHIIEQPEYNVDFIDKLKKQGYDSIKSSDGKQLLVFDPANVKTKSQLEQIWKQANKK